MSASCLYCEEPIQAGEPCNTLTVLDAKGLRLAKEHRECFARRVLGSVGHQMHKCPCHGGTLEDPPGMTRREAAIAAALHYGMATQMCSDA